MRVPVRFGIWLLILSGLGCAPNVPIYKLYPGPSLPENELSVLKMGAGTAMIIDGLNVSSADYGIVHLRPGRHQLGVGFVYTVVETEWIESDFRHPVACATNTPELSLDRGQDYWVLRTKTGLRIQIANTGEIVWRCELP